MAFKLTELCTYDLRTPVGQYVLLVRSIRCKMSLMLVSFLHNKDVMG
jgi:hypothetical protein